MIEAGLRVWVQYEDLKLLTQIIDGKIAAEIVTDIYTAMNLAEPRSRFDPTPKKEGDVIISTIS